MSQGCRPTNPVHPSFSCKEGTITPLHIEALGVILSVEADEATEILQAYADVMEIGNIKAINIRDCVTTNTVVEALLIASRIFILHECLSYRICKDVAEPVRGTLYRQARIAARNWGLGSKGQPHLAERVDWKVSEPRSKAKLPALQTHELFSTRILWALQFSIRA